MLVLGVFCVCIAGTALMPPCQRAQAHPVALDLAAPAARTVAKGAQTPSTSNTTP